MTLHVIGNVTEDLVFRLDRLPAPGETRIAVDRLADIGGKGFNQAVIAARTGVPVRLTAPIGGDEAGRRAVAIAAAERLAAHLPVLGPATDQSIILVDDAGENVIVSSAAAAAALTPEAAALAAGAVQTGDCLLLQGNLTREATIAALAVARGKGVETAVNAAPIQWSFDGLLSKVDLLIVNREEACNLGRQRDARAAVQALLSAGAGAVLLTLGAEGALLVGADSSLAVPAGPADVVDTAGAGDTFTAVFLAARHLRLAKTAALEAASQAAALTVSRAGTFSAFPSQAELERILGRFQ